VSDALKVNSVFADTINQLRRGRKDFIIQMRKLDERDRSTVTDMKHFSQGASVCLDEKEKLEAKHKRHLFEYSNEVRVRVRVRTRRGAACAYPNPNPNPDPYP
jgi:hypothetical protein|tara:strand:- start:300 stop:608 length:309 start_codon:yes stop_codon:yes gene_type:complete